MGNIEILLLILIILIIILIGLCAKIFYVRNKVKSSIIKGITRNTQKLLNDEKMDIDLSAWLYKLKFSNEAENIKNAVQISINGFVSNDEIYHAGLAIYKQLFANYKLLVIDLYTIENESILGFWYSLTFKTKIFTLEMLLTEVMYEEIVDATIRRSIPQKHRLRQIVDICNQRHIKIFFKGGHLLRKYLSLEVLNGNDFRRIPAILSLSSETNWSINEFCFAKTCHFVFLPPLDFFGYLVSKNKEIDYHDISLLINEANNIYKYAGESDDYNVIGGYGIFEVGNDTSRLSFYSEINRKLLTPIFECFSNPEKELFRIMCMHPISFSLEYLMYLFEKFKIDREFLRKAANLGVLVKIEDSFFNFEVENYVSSKCAETLQPYTFFEKEIDGILEIAECSQNEQEFVMKMITSGISERKSIRYLSLYRDVKEKLDMGFLISDYLNSSKIMDSPLFSILFKESSYKGDVRLFSYYIPEVIKNSFIIYIEPQNSTKDIETVLTLSSEYEDLNDMHSLPHWLCERILNDDGGFSELEYFNQELNNVKKVPERYFSNLLRKKVNVSKPVYNVCQQYATLGLLQNAYWRYNG